MMKNLGRPPFRGPNMSDSNLVLTLQLIYAKGDVTALLQRGLEFSQIPMIINEALERGFIMELDGNLQLTEKGMLKMRLGSAGLKIRPDGGWISPLDHLRIEKLALDEVYLPDQETVGFLEQGH